jgi:hypothetical protein
MLRDKALVVYSIHAINQLPDDKSLYCLHKINLLKNNLLNNGLFNNNLCVRPIKC